MSAAAQLMHSKIVKSLEEKVKKKYALTATEVEVRDPETGLIVGEIDLVGVVNGNWDIYEVKVNDGFSKARKQLRNLKNYLKEYGEINLYYYSGRENKIIRVD